MNTNQSDPPTIVCDVTAIPADAREQHVRNAPRIFQAVEEIRELADGYEFRLPNEGGMWLALATFVENERRCCPFYRFGLTVEANNGPLWLALTGPEGSKELLTIALGGSSAEGLIFSQQSLSRTVHVYTQDNNKSTSPIAAGSVTDIVGRILTNAA